MRSRGPVLVVTRNEIFADTYVLGFRERRMLAISASSSEEAVALLHEARARAIMFDLDQATDWARCQDIVDAAKRHGVPVLALATWSDAWLRRRVFDAGFAAFVANPCAINVVIDTLLRLEAGEREIEVVTSPVASAALD